MKIIVFLFSVLTSVTAFAIAQDDTFLHKASKRPFVSKIIGGIVGLPGEITTGISNYIARNEYDERDGFKKSKYVYQCSAPIPVTRDQFPINDVTQMYHTWLEVGPESFGMPYTQKATYFGGTSVITSPDPFLPFTNTTKVCDPIHQPEEEEEVAYAQKFKCVADALSIKNNVLDDVLSQDSGSAKTVYFQYNALTNNCLSAVKFITECAGGRISQNPNLGVGSDIEEENIQMIEHSFDHINYLKTINPDFESIDKLMPPLNIKTVKDHSFRCINKCDSLKKEIRTTFGRMRDQFSVIDHPMYIDLTKRLTKTLENLDDEDNILNLKKMIDGLKTELANGGAPEAREIPKIKLCNEIRRGCGF